MEYQAKLQEGKLQDIATYQYRFISCCFTSAFTSADIFRQLFGTNSKLSRRRFLSQKCLQNTSHPHPFNSKLLGPPKVFYWCSLRWSFVLASTFKRYIFDEFLWSVLRKQNNHSSELNILSNSKEFREFLENLVRDLNANWFATYWWYSYSS